MQRIWIADFSESTQLRTINEDDGEVAGVLPKSRALLGP